MECLAKSAGTQGSREEKGCFSNQLARETPSNSDALFKVII